jgi:hypothetical protein
VSEPVAEAFHVPDGGSGLPPGRSVLEMLLGISTAEAPREGRRWWSVRRGGATRLLLPAAQKARETALQLQSGWLHQWATRSQLRVRSIARSPDLHGSRPGDAPLDAYLSELFPGDPLEFAVHIGTPSVYQKHTIQCQDGTGAVRAYLKVESGPWSAESIRNEAGVLHELTRSGPLRGGVPVVLKTGNTWGRTVSLLSAPHTSGQRAPRALNEEVARFATHLFNSEQHLLPWAASPVRSRVLRSIEALAAAGEKNAADLLTKSVDFLESGFGSQLLPHGRVHGDFVPWNIRLLPEPYAFDWEWSRIALPFHDHFHHEVFPQLGSRRGRQPRQIDSTRKSPRLIALFDRLPHGELPFPTSDDRWWQAYISDAFAFYALSTSANGERLSSSGLIMKLEELLRCALEAAGPTP